MEKNDPIPFLFITGRPRTGTTLLRMLFDAHPGVIIPTECQFVVNLYSRYGQTRDWTHGKLKAFANDLQTQWKFEHWRIDHNKLVQALLTHKPFNNYGEVCRAVYSEYKSIYPKSEMVLLADKNPGYSIYTQRIKKIIPEARFIYINRDYRDNYLSIKESGFDLPIPSLPAQKWKYFYNSIRRAAAKNPNDYLILNYEDLVTQPEDTFIKVCQFAGISYTDTVFSFYQKKDEFNQLYDETILHSIHKRIMEPVNRKRLGIWGKKLREKEVRLLDATIGSLAEKAGYNRKYRKQPVTIYLMTIPGRTLAAMLFIATKVIDKLPAGLRMNILSKWPRKIGLTILSVINPARHKTLKTKHTENQR